MATLTYTSKRSISARSAVRALDKALVARQRKLQAYLARLQRNTTRYNHCVAVLCTAEPTSRRYIAALHVVKQRRVQMNVMHEALARLGA